MYILVLVAVFFVPYVVANALINSYKKQQDLKLGLLGNKLFLESVPTLYIEKDKNTLYLFSKKDDKFYCQAATIEELAKEYSNTKTDFNFIAKVLHDNKELWFIEGDVLDEIIIKVSL